MLGALLLPALLGHLVPTTTIVGDSLATPITGAPVEELWPISLEIQIVRQSSASSPEAIVARHRVQVPDGHRFSLARVIDTDRGRREFALDITPRHHPARTIELEWHLSVRDAAYRPMDLGRYLLHRMQLGEMLPEGVLQLGDPTLQIARADIATTVRSTWNEVVAIDGEPHEIRVFARSTRG